MDESLKTQLVEAGVNYDVAISRFMGKEELYKMFLGKFLADDNFSKLQQSVEKEDVDAAFKAAHTLKGLAGNLGFDNLLEINVPMVEVLRKGSFDGVPELFEELKERYENLCSLLKKIA